MGTQDNSVMSTGRAAAYLGRNVKTLQRWDREGTLTPAGRTGTGRRAYTQAQLDEFLGRQVRPVGPERIIIYCRVSSTAQKPDLKNQRRVLEEFCTARGLAGAEFVEEVGGGLNFGRKRFLEIMDAVSRREVKTLVVAHKDRLVRFGYVWFERHCQQHGCDVLVLNNETLSSEQEMVQDLMTIIHCFSSRLYGLRNYKKKLKEALEQDLKDAP